jgi:hypothetical protein
VDFASKQIPVEALVFSCPFGEARDGCPVEYLRQIPVLDALVAVSEMAAEDLDGLLAQHEICLSERAAARSENFA